MATRMIDDCAATISPAGRSSDKTALRQQDEGALFRQLPIGNTFCRIYNERNAEFLLLQMTDEQELQRIDSEVSAIAQSSAHLFLFAAVPVKN